MLDQHHTHAEATRFALTAAVRPTAAHFVGSWCPVQSDVVVGSPSKQRSRQSARATVTSRVVSNRVDQSELMLGGLIGGFDQKNGDGVLRGVGQPGL